MKTLFKHFCICGVVGWCLEIIFTALHSLQRHEFSLRGNTSIWMFPIYGMAVILGPISNKLRKKSCFMRGVLYALSIFTIEYISGCFLMKRKCCPWNYTFSKWNYKNVIRIDYFPFWILTGLLYEHTLSALTAKQNSNETKTATDF